MRISDWSSDVCSSDLVTHAVEDQRHFVKGMRVNLGLEMPIASLTPTDTGTEATTVYLAHNLPEPRYDEALAQLMKTQGVQHMTWRPGDRLQVAQGAGQSIVVGGTRSEENTSELQ